MPQSSAVVARVVIAPTPRKDCVMQKILIAYASKAGSTAEVAEFIAKVMREAGAAVDVRPVRDVRDISAYQGVLLGSAIRMGKVLPEVVNFAKTHAAALAHLPVAYFNVNMTLKDDTPENRTIVDAYLDPLRAICTPVSTAAFAGKMDYSRLGWLLRFFFSRSKGKEENPIPEGNWLDWEKIRTWALEVLPLLQAERLPA
ncbi:flavodoxin [Chloroflexi bacterium CFX3]|nr:flavodoxin [Chloroflexi bacterium CFX3]